MRIRKLIEFKIGKDRKNFNKWYKYKKKENFT